ncbi:50S ribosomal protein L25/general stress protein Ctc [Hahella sp. SMD15-11]|uniref:Large ribosomal subunit protein bL25 n=1 Tax=Thermohahella caldifontis TaxID=3142973 RepID=A0AB39UWX1_9GAMM
MSDIQFNVSVRDVQGKGASRRLRREMKVPGILYGGDKAPLNIAIPENELMKVLDTESFYSHVIELNIDGNKERAILKDLQRHPYKPTVLHIDFMRVVAGHKITVQVPLHFINEDKCDAIKNQGGKANHLLNEVEIECLPKDLPDFIEVDLAEVKMDEILHLSDLKLPEGVELVALRHGPDHDLPVVAIHKPKGAAEAEGEAEGEEAGE